MWNDVCEYGKVDEIQDIPDQICGERVGCTYGVYVGKTTEAVLIPYLLM